MIHSQTSNQKAVLAELAERARLASDSARVELDQRLVSDAGLSQSDIEALREHFSSSEITITFPAEKAAALNQAGIQAGTQAGATGGATLLIDVLMTETALLNYWITRTTGGQAPDGGRQRSAVEVVLFQYPEFQQHLKPNQHEAHDRPRFGAVNQYKQTVSSRDEEIEGYGSVSIVLKPHMLQYATLTSADTNEVAGPRCEHILDLIRTAKRQAGPSGDWRQDVAGQQAEKYRRLLPPVGSFSALDHVILDFDATQGHAMSWGRWIKNLVEVARGVPQPGALKYWEAQIHAPITFATDVAIIRASYRKLFGTDVGVKVQQWARLNQLPLVWGHYEHVVCDPTVQLPPGAVVADEDLKYWRHLRTKTRQSLTNAVAHFDAQWRSIADLRSKAQPQIQASMLPRDTAKRHWVTLWASMPTELRVDPMPAVNNMAVDSRWRDIAKQPNTSAG